MGFDGISKFPLFVACHKVEANKKAGRKRPALMGL
jgi:hypothetical protein